MRGRHALAARLGIRQTVHSGKVAADGEVFERRGHDQHACVSIPEQRLERREKFPAQRLAHAVAGLDVVHHDPNNSAPVALYLDSGHVLLPTRLRQPGKLHYPKT